MSLSTLLNIPCTLIRQSTSDQGGTVEVDEDTYGNPIPAAAGASPSDDNEEVDTVCWLQQERRTEPGDAGEMSDAFWTIFFPWGTELDTSDAVDVYGYGRFELVGDPWPAKQGSSRMWHVESTGRRTGEIEGS